MNLEKLKKDLAMLDGKPPYDKPNNIYRDDAYFAHSLEQKYGKPLKELRKIAEGESK